MARRRELRGIANDIAYHCVSRNNDIDGYWGVGKIYGMAIENLKNEVEIHIPSELMLPPDLARFRKHLEKMFPPQKLYLGNFVQSFQIKFKFRLLLDDSKRGQHAHCSCTVSMIDELDKIWSGVATTFCYPHNTRFEHKSNRV